MKKLFTLTIFLTLALLTFGQSKYKQDLVDLATIEFPNQPEISDTINNKTFTYSNDTAHYLVSILDIQSTPQLWPDQNNLDEFYSNFINGALHQADGQLVQKMPFEIDGMKGVEFIFESSSPDLPELRYSRVLFVNKTIIMIGLWSSSINKEWLNLEKDKFFNSFVFKDKLAISQTKAKGDKYYEIGYKIGTVATYLFIAIVVGVIIYLLNRSSKKRRLRNSS